MLDAQAAMDHAETIDFEKYRYNMIEQQIRPWDVFDLRILNTFQTLWRHEFVPLQFRHLAYADFEIPIGHNQHMLRPNMEGRLLETAAIQPSDRILEIGTGTGYFTACLANLGEHVESIDCFGDYSRQAADRLAFTDLKHKVRLVEADIKDPHWQPQENGYDVIMVTAAVADRTDLDLLIKKLNPQGRLVAIVGIPPAMEAVLVNRAIGSALEIRSLFETKTDYLLGFEPQAQFLF